MIKAIFWLFFAPAIPLFSNAVTYEMSKGRFGDQLMGFLHAKWVSYRYNIPLLYKPFLHSEEFALHELEELWTEEKEKSFERIVTCLDELTDNSLYVIPFFSDLKEDSIFHPEWPTLAIDWEDRGFRNALRTLFAPRKEIPQIVHEPNCLTVALHVRKGGGVDHSNSYFIWPMRFAPDSYYIECLHRLRRLFPNREICAHIFTDDLHPEQLAAKFQSHLPDLHFTYREQGNGPDAHVLDDFFAMAHFDCLIRSASNFTLVPSLIGDYKVIMTPKHGYWVVANGSGEYYVDEIDMQVYE
ncbi:MAG TPA: hypothetical protein VLF94_00110 [Chlamydiales bacterium]|nr:hypothetical protein [Chlamydiales bacterium]